MNTTILVTGIGSGIGLQLTRLLLEKQYYVVGIARTDNQEIKSLRLKFGNKLQVYLLDLSDLSATKIEVEKIMESNPTISILVNNAGTYREVRKETPEKIEMTVAVNVLAPYLLANSFLRHRKEKGGQILNVTSIGEKYAPDLWNDVQSKISYSGNSVYNFSKLWLTALTFKLAAKNPYFSINCAHPGATSSNLIKDSDVDRMPFMLRSVFSVARIFRQSPETSAKGLLKIIEEAERDGITATFYNGSKKTKSSSKSREINIQNLALEKASNILNQITGP